MGAALNELISYMEKDGVLVFHHANNIDTFTSDVHEELADFYKLVGIKVDYLIPLHSPYYEVVYKVNENNTGDLRKLTVEQLRDLFNSHYVIFVPRLWEVKYEP